MVSSYNDKSYNPIRETVVAPSRDEALKVLHDKYGNNYEVDDMKIVPAKRRLFSLKPKMQVEITYHQKFPSVNPGYQFKTSAVPNMNDRISEKDAFMASRNDFLNRSDSSVTNVLQMGVISKKIDDITSKLDSLVQDAGTKEEHPSISKIIDLLDENGFTKSYNEKMASRLKSEFSLEDLDDFDLVQRTVADWIGESILIEKEAYVRPPKVIIIVGPTGVGKTTTVAKMAAKIAVSAHNDSEEKVRPVIKMITVDTMRVAAEEQLSHWAEIINVGVDKAEKSSDLQKLYDLYSGNSDYIFIDTSGYSPNDFENIGKMRQILDVKNMNENVYLAVLAGINSRDLENIIRNYEVFNFKSVIVTKCDETSTYGNLLSVLYEKGKKISYITTGQEVLNTIEPASPIYFLKNLRGFNLDEQHLKQKFGTKEK